MRPGETGGLLERRYDRHKVIRLSFAYIYIEVIRCQSPQPTSLAGKPFAAGSILSQWAGARCSTDCRGKVLCVSQKSLIALTISWSLFASDGLVRNALAPRR